MKDLAHTLKALRTRNNLSQQAVADWFGINRASVNAWENPDKKALPERERLQVLARKYGTTVDAILDGSALVESSQDDPSNTLTAGDPKAYADQSLYKAVRVVDVVRVNAAGLLEVIPSAQDGTRFIRTDKLQRAGKYYCWIVAASDNPVLRPGAAILVDPEAPIKMDRLCIVTLTTGGARLLAPLVQSDSSIKFETMDGNAVSLLRNDIQKMEYVVAIDSDPEDAATPLSTGP